MGVKAKYTCILAFGLLFIIPSCKDDVNDGESPSNVVFPADSVSYDQHLQPLFNQACAFAGCHDDGPHTSPLKLTSYFNTALAIPGVVVQGQPDQSTLVFRIQGSVGQRMPLNANPLNHNQINGIRTWVAEGARQN